MIYMIIMIIFCISYSVTKRFSANLFEDQRFYIFQRTRKNYRFLESFWHVFKVKHKSLLDKPSCLTTECHFQTWFLVISVVVYIVYGVERNI